MSELGTRLAFAGRVTASAVIVGLIALAVTVPDTDIGRRGVDPVARAHVPELAALVGQPLPSLAFLDLEGRIVKSEDLLGKKALITFERSVDW